MYNEANSFCAKKNHFSLHMHIMFLSMLRFLLWHVFYRNTRRPLQSFLLLHRELWCTVIMHNLDTMKLFILMKKLSCLLNRVVSLYTFVAMLLLSRKE